MVCWSAGCRLCGQGAAPGELVSGCELRRTTRMSEVWARTRWWLDGGFVRGVGHRVVRAAGYRMGRLAGGSIPTLGAATMESLCCG